MTPSVHVVVTRKRSGSEPITKRGLSLLLTALGVAALLDIAYWVLWFTARDQIAADTSAGYVEFEQAFPLPDLWLLVCIIGGLITLIQRRQMALFWLLAVGGAGMYLCTIDSLYDLEHGVWGRGANGLTELGIVVFTAVLSVTLMWWGWRRRHTLLNAPWSVHSPPSH